ncbi:hypothetical protein APUTEX25_005767 [Auxenochlorella protothecoides]|uniref:Mre11 DNA-binding domain-containing protein n=1 Tax=Auxenochlorella protothecoides TaxID=3075 RepID=A0A3M7L2N3_AUXPR|nr:hypothetical protein APUTEX25_005767 [Auxenochlorella protothecoides]|eukprot:RMZ55726.1 hypothetical protein APUTEX25_005767 [Auxenochlorella protothecoides]
MDEVMCIAKREKVDFVLLGGDLFHDNKPSRQTVVKAMEIFARHCMSDDPVGFRVISDQRQNFASGRVNFENSNYNIGLPVFTIHGNHDDPGGTENLSAVDILSTGALLNYFGKVAIAGEGVGKVRIAPVLIQKGATKLALFGLGNLRDERLCRLFQTPACVEWIRPADTPDYPRDEWFNLFVLHQNRTPHSQGAKNYVKESHLARFLDLVIWGHEHECLADPWDSVETGGAFSVLQPGSSVATALSEGEAKRKHVVVLEIMGHHWRTIKHPLETVRRFEFETVVLAEHTKKLDPEDPETVTAFLDARVSAMIARAVRGRPPASPKLPLVRLRVDYTGFSTINTQRFGTRFVGQVANPHDIVLWQKPPARRAREESATRAGNAPVVPIRPEALDEAHIEDLVSQHLQHDLELLPEVELAEALHEFVDKENRNALSEAVSRVLEETQAAAAARGGEETGTSAAGEGRRGARGGADAAVPSGPTPPSRQGGKPAKPEEGEVLESIARATARRRLSHGLGTGHSELQDADMSEAIFTDSGKHSAPDASEVPFALRWLAAELPGRAGRWMEAVSAFQALLGLCVTQSGIAEREGDAEASRLWGGRRARAAAALANVHAQQQQYPAALAVLDAQLGADPRRIDTWLHAAQVQLRVGDLPGAEASVASAAFLAGEAEGPAAAHGMRAVRHARGLLAVARQDWPAAAAAFSSCLREDARDAEAVGDLAVCQLFNRNVESGVAVLEAGFQAQPWAMLKAPLVSSLALMYDLARPDSGAKERFGAWVARIAPDDLDMSCMSPG